MEKKKTSKYLFTTCGKVRAATPLPSTAHTIPNGSLQSRSARCRRNYWQLSACISTEITKKRSRRGSSRLRKSKHTNVSNSVVVHVCILSLFDATSFGIFCTCRHQAGSRCTHRQHVPYSAAQTVHWCTVGLGLGLGSGSQRYKRAYEMAAEIVK